MDLRRLVLLISAAFIFLFEGSALAACRNIDLVDRVKGVAARLLIPGPGEALAAGMVTIRWFGHSFFEIVSSKGTKIFTDPFGPMGFPLPDVSGHIVTVGREHGNHNNVGLVKGSPKVLRGITPDGQQWNKVNLSVRDVMIYNVPVYQRGVPGNLKGAAFVFEVDGMCIVHLGDLSHQLNKDQLDMIGKVDVLLIPIGGVYTMDAETAKEVLNQLKPKIAVPMHYWYNIAVLNRFVDGGWKVRYIGGNQFSVSKESLPPALEVFVLTLS